MELRSVQSPSLSTTTIPTRTHSPFLSGRRVVFNSLQPNNTQKNVPFKYTSGVKLVRHGVRASGIANLSSQSVGPIPEDVLKDENLVFVAGATGKVGSRTVRELLKLGFKVRAGVRSVQRAETLVQSVQQLKLDEAAKETQPIERLEVVECDLEIKEKIGPALGNASLVICCIGASEKEVFDVTGPYRIDYQATKNLIDAATVAKVNHFILLTSLGTNKVGFPAAILNLFWGVLIWKRKAEEALLASGIPYTIVRPGGMERPTDAYKETHNITLSTEDTLFGGQVSNLQVAELMAFMAKNRDLSYCKVVEVVAETTAPLTPMGELLARIPAQRTLPTKEKNAASATEPISRTTDSETSDISSEREALQPKQASTRPLSPYTAYEDLKPPVSPTPKSPGGSEGVKTIENAPRPISIDSEASTVPASIASTEEPKLSDIAVQKTRPLSPFAIYEDLKPPTSPSPTPSNSKDAGTPIKAEIASEFTTGNDVADLQHVNTDSDPAQALASNKSPYHVYDDLKPPTSPSPSSPTISTPSATPADNGSQMTATPESSSPHIALKPRPLSPFPMYEDLKPPTSPTPSPRK